MPDQPTLLCLLNQVINLCLQLWTYQGHLAHHGLQEPLPWKPLLEPKLEVYLKWQVAFSITSTFFMDFHEHESRRPSSPQLYLKNTKHTQQTARHHLGIWFLPFPMPLCVHIRYLGIGLILARLINHFCCGQTHNIYSFDALITSIH